MLTAMLAALLTLGLFAIPPSPGLAQASAPDLRTFYFFQALGRIAHHDPKGLGSEAARASDWARGRERLAVLPRGETDFALTDGDEAFGVSIELAGALSRMAAYMDLSTKARLSPVPTSELREAAASPETVERIRALFERAIAEAVVLDGEPVVPELGGDALLVGGVMELRSFTDPTRTALRAVAQRRGDPDALAALFEEEPESAALLDVHGQLERELALYSERAARGVPLERRRRPLDMAVETVLRNGSDTFTLHPRAQLETILDSDWSEGRLIGLWHLHPPGWSARAWTAAAPPSPDDRQVARTSGQFLTIVFHPDGFDVHDLQTPALGPAPPATPERRISHRSEAWREHFAARHAAWRARLR